MNPTLVYRGKKRDVADEGYDTALFNTGDMPIGSTKVSLSILQGLTVCWFAVYNYDQGIKIYFGSK